MKHPRLGLQKSIPRRRFLRKEATKAEQVLWKELRSKKFSQIKFRRQHGVGPYIVDFSALRGKLVIEVDGDIHLLPNQKLQDKKRESDLESLGFQIIRFSNEEVLRNLKEVLMEIKKVLKSVSE